MGCKWHNGQEFTYPTKEIALQNYDANLSFLEYRYQKKEIALYHVSLMHLTRLKTRCPVCGGDADILTFMICMVGDHEPSTSIVCEHCVNPGQDPMMNEVGIYYFKEPCFEDNEGEKSFAQHKYIITIEDLKGKANA